MCTNVYLILLQCPSDLRNAYNFTKKPYNRLFIYLFIYIPLIHPRLDNHKDMELVKYV